MMPVKVEREAGGWASRCARWARTEAAILVPLASALALSAWGIAATGTQHGWTGTAGLSLWLFPTILAAAYGVVRHAESLAHKFGEPSGTLILTLSAVAVEVLMVSAMMLNGHDNPTMARDTIYSTLMLIMNGQIGLAVLLGGLRHGEQTYNLKSSNAFFSMILALAGLGLFLPMFVLAESKDALEMFLIFSFLALYGLFLRIQMKEHRYFFTDGSDARRAGGGHPEGSGGVRYHAGMLLVALLSVGYLGEALARVLDGAVERLHVNGGWVSLIVALLILSPEGLTAIRAGLANEMQRVVNISMGSALSTVGLTIPAVLLISMYTGRDITLALDRDQGVMLFFSLLIGMRSYSVGETNILQGLIHFVLFVAFIVLIVI